MTSTPRAWSDDLGDYWEHHSAVPTMEVWEEVEEPKKGRRKASPVKQGFIGFFRLKERHD